MSAKVLQKVTQTPENGVSKGFSLEQLAQIAQLIDAALDARPARRYLTTGGAAEYLGVSSKWIRDHRSQLAPCTVGMGEDGSMRFDSHALDAFVAGCTAAHAERKAEQANAPEGGAE